MLYFVYDKEICAGEGHRQRKRGKIMCQKWKDNKADIKVSILSVRTGHKAHKCGAGSHDPRPKRERTRNASNRNAMRDWWLRSYPCCILCTTRSDVGNKGLPISNTKGVLWKGIGSVCGVGSCFPAKTLGIASVHLVRKSTRCNISQQDLVPDYGTGLPLPMGRKNGFEFKYKGQE